MQIKIPDPSPLSYPVSYDHWLRVGNAKILEAWFGVILTLIRSCNSAEDPDSSPQVTITEIDELCMLSILWSGCYDNPREIENRMYRVFKLGISELYRTSQIDSWIEQVKFISRDEKYCTLFARSKGGELALRVMREIGSGAL